MTSLAERLGSSKVLRADGAVGSLLQARGHAGCLERLNLDAPDVIRRMHREYRDAGAELLWTNTFGATPLRLAAAGLADRTEALNEAAARLAREVAGDGAFVVGSVGPCGGVLRPYGDLDPVVVRAGVLRQVEGLAQGGIDAVVVETMMDLEEALVALDAAREKARGLPVLASLTFQETPSGPFTAFGHAPADAARRLAAAGAAAVGANCGTGPAAMVSVVRALRDAVDCPVLCKPNAGLPRATDQGPVWPADPEAFARAVCGLAEAGASILGGCCGTTPAHIRAMTSALSLAEDRP